MNLYNHALRGRAAAYLAITAGLLAMLLLSMRPATVSADSSIPAFSEASTQAASDRSCRYGAAVLATNQVSWLDQFKLGWYINFGSQSHPGANNAEFAPIVRVQQTRNGCTRLPTYTITPALTDEQLGARIRSLRGAMWIVGNEPDRGPNPEDVTCASRVQDDTAPDVYARAYFEVYNYIKNIDPTARVSNAPLVEITPGRLQYLDIVWNTYRATYGVDMPVDVWNIHVYILPEALPDGQPNGIANVAVGTDPSLAIRESGGQAAQCSQAGVYCWAEHDDMAVFSGQVVAMRQWMKDHGQREKPLVLSEYSLLYPYLFDPNDPASCFKDEFGNCFTPARVSAFVSNSLNFLETATDPVLGFPHDGNRLVQRWAWYSIATRGAGEVSNLTDIGATQATAIGSAYSGRAAAAPRTVNLFPTTAVGSSGGVGVNSVLLTAEVQNQGSVPVEQSFIVSFYRDAGLTDLIGSVVVPPSIAGCGSSSARAQITWSGASPGKQLFWVKVDANGAIAESQEEDNVMQGQVVVPSEKLWSPLLMRGASLH